MKLKDLIMTMRQYSISTKEFLRIYSLKELFSFPISIFYIISEYKSSIKAQNPNNNSLELASLLNVLHLVACWEKSPKPSVKILLSRKEKLNEQNQINHSTSNRKRI